MVRTGATPVTSTALSPVPASTAVTTLPSADSSTGQAPPRLFEPTPPLEMGERGAVDPIHRYCCRDTRRIACAAPSARPYRTA